MCQQKLQNSTVMQNKERNSCKFLFLEDVKNRNLISWCDSASSQRNWCDNMLTCRTKASCRERKKEIWGSWGSSACALQWKKKQVYVNFSSPYYLSDIFQLSLYAGINCDVKLHSNGIKKQLKPTATDNISVNEQKLFQNWWSFYDVLTLGKCFQHFNIKNAYCK